MSTVYIKYMQVLIGKCFERSTGKKHKYKYIVKHFTKVLRQHEYPPAAKVNMHIFLNEE